MDRGTIDTDLHCRSCWEAAWAWLLCSWEQLPLSGTASSSRLRMLAWSWEGSS